MAKTRLSRYADDKKDKDVITSDKDIRISSDIDGDPLVWCATPGGENPDVIINTKRGEILSITVGDYNDS